MDKRGMYSIGILLLCMIALLFYINQSDNRMKEIKGVEHQQNILDNNIELREPNAEEVVPDWSETWNDDKLSDVITDEKSYREGSEGYLVKEVAQDQAIVEYVMIQEGNLRELLYIELLQEGNGENMRESINKYPAGTLLETAGLNQQVIDNLFYTQELTEAIKERIVGKSYEKDCDIPYSEFRYTRVLHRGFDQKTYIGELIVNKVIAEDILEIMKELYECSYPIERMVLIDDYDADDISSMEHNNSSAFNYRKIDGTTKLSLHSYGLAIDINPLYNPYIRNINGELVVLPKNSVPYVDRNDNNPYFIKKDDVCYKAFIKRGFSWGGDWKNKKDYQHFEKSVVE